MNPIGIVLVTLFLVFIVWSATSVLWENRRRRREHLQEVSDWKLDTKIWHALMDAGIDPKSPPPCPPSRLTSCGCDYCLGKNR